MAKQTNCDCGLMVPTQSEDEKSDTSSCMPKEIHEIDVSLEQALEMAHTVESTVTV